ncbi:MAG: DUF3221 domain-containing protein [Chloroflexi bacterium]|nr:DUF3221 domain-containing protein [Chloroflexota bacterium]
MTRSRSIPAKAALLALAAGLTLLLLGACTSDGDAAPASGDPDIRGVITSITAGSGDVIGSVRIEGAIDQDTKYDKAIVRVESDTRILRQVGNAMMEVTFGDLAVGQTVEAWFTGPVAESYPVQVKASQIVIVG